MTRAPVLGVLLLTGSTLARASSPKREQKPLRLAAHRRMCTVGESLGGAWRTGGANGSRPTWRPVASAACSSAPLPRRLAVTFVGDSHLREMMLGLCKLRRGKPRPGCIVGPLCELSLSCHTPGLRLSWVAKLSVRDSSPAFEPKQPCVPDVLVLDSLHWDLMALTTWSNSVLATQLRATSQRALPGALVERVAAEWGANCSAYVARTKRAYSARAARSHASCPDSARRGYGHAPPLVVWATTHATYTPVALAAGVRGLDGKTHIADCTTQSAYAAAQPTRGQPFRRCCQPLSGKLVAALNERARRVARAHGMLLLDVERMMQPLPLAKTLCMGRGAPAPQLLGAGRETRARRCHGGGVPLRVESSRCFRLGREVVCKVYLLGVKFILFFCSAEKKITR